MYMLEASMACLGADVVTSSDVVHLLGWLQLCAGTVIHFGNKACPTLSPVAVSLSVLSAGRILLCWTSRSFQANDHKLVGPGKVHTGHVWCGVAQGLW
jgi:hypothetical protein